MKQIQLQNIYLKLRPTESKTAYTKQQNYCVTLINKGKKEYYGSEADLGLLQHPRWSSL